jgi:hypothetical protein
MGAVKAILTLVAEFTFRYYGGAFEGGLPACVQPVDEEKLA